MTENVLQAISEPPSPFKPCLSCGVPSSGSRNAGAYCSECRLKPKSGPRKDNFSSSARGYDHQWRRLSNAARSLQNFCSDCGSNNDLTGDHLRWPARTLADVDVVCRSCNSKRGALRHA